MGNRRLAMGVLSALLSGCGSDAADPNPADAGPSATVHLIGRFDSNPAGARFAWPGSTILTRFEGSDLSIELEDSGGNQFDVWIDGVAQPVLVPGGGGGSYTLASGLTNAPHDVRVSRRTESFFGVTRFIGFTGAPLVATPAPTRLIEMVGDSITCGYGVLGDTATCSFSADTEAETHAWGAIAADELGAAHAAIAYSGKGVYENNGGEPGILMPELFERTFADDDSIPWTFSYTPQVVVVNLGTNDFTNGDPGQPFVDAYLAFINQIRGHYPDAWILVAMSPMLSDSFPGSAMHRTLARGYLQDVVAAARTAGDDRVDYLDIAEQDPADGYGCDYHPNQLTQEKMAAALVMKIREVTGW